MRGCFLDLSPYIPKSLVLPAYAGMFLVRNFGILNADGSPRVCGDVSGNLEGDKNVTWFSPRMRGCFQDRRRSEQRFHVLPAYAGMFLELSCFFSFGICSPRVCGDVSRSPNSGSPRRRFSPRMRGCFSKARRLLRTKQVLPAYAGMFLSIKIYVLTIDGSPRVCGDVSGDMARLVSVLEFSPRMRGCFLAAALHQRARTVLPAYAGMFPKAIKSRLKISSSPRVCGDVSQ